MKHLVITIVLISVTLTATPVYPWDEPKDFRGLKFGEDIEKQIPLCTREMLDRYFQYNQKCWWKSASSQLYEINGFEPLAGVKLTTLGQQINGGLEYITASFASSSFRTVLAILIERYGKPTGIEDSEWVSKGGVRLKNSIARWEGDNIRIDITRFSTRSEYSGLTYTTNVYRNWALQREQERIKGAAKDL